MESATIREVQHNLAAYVRKVENVQEVEIRRRNHVVAKLVPTSTTSNSVTDPKWGEVRERLQRMWGDRPAKGKPASEIVYESRGER